MTDAAFQPKVRNIFRGYDNSRPVTYDCPPLLKVPGRVEQISKGGTKYNTADDFLTKLLVFFVGKCKSSDNIITFKRWTDILL